MRRGFTIYDLRFTRAVEIRRGRRNPYLVNRKS